MATLYSLKLSCLGHGRRGRRRKRWCRQEPSIKPGPTVDTPQHCTLQGLNVYILQFTSKVLLFPRNVQLLELVT